MKPRNGREREVERLARRLPGLTDAQVRWVDDKVIEWHINCSGKRCWCEKCGHSFVSSPEGGSIICPHCGTVLPVERNRKTTVKGIDYIQIVTTFKGWQLIRYILVRWNGRIGEKPRLYFQEVIQKWCQPGRPTVTRGTPLVMLPYWASIPYSRYGTLSIKNPTYFNTEWMQVHVYPRICLYKPYREGVHKAANFARTCAEDVLAIIYTNPYFETLYKAGKTAELKAIWDYYPKFQKYWPSVKVALRHGFRPEFWGDYFDYLGMLQYLGKDMHSPRYVAPTDYNDIHDLILRQYQNKKEAAERAQREREAARRAEWEEEQKKKDAEAVASFAGRMARFKSFFIAGNGMEIHPLMTIEEFKEEGKAMHHCVFALGYYKKTDSLILSARDDRGKRIETIEVGIKEGEVLQSRGVCNSITDRHDEIISLVKKAIPAIQRMAAP